MICPKQRGNRGQDAMRSTPRFGPLFIRPWWTWCAVLRVLASWRELPLPIPCPLSLHMIRAMADSRSMEEQVGSSKPSVGFLLR